MPTVQSILGLMALKVSTLPLGHHIDKMCSRHFKEVSVLRHFRSLKTLVETGHRLFHQPCPLHRLRQVPFIVQKRKHFTIKTVYSVT